MPRRKKRGWFQKLINPRFAVTIGEYERPRDYKEISPFSSRRAAKKYADEWLLPMKTRPIRIKRI